VSFIEAPHGIEIFPYLSSCGSEYIVGGFLHKNPSSGKDYLRKKLVISMSY